MENLKLTSGEKNVLKKRGFLVKQTITLKDLLKNIPFQFLLLALFSGIGFIIGMIFITLGVETDSIIIDSMFLTTIPVFLYISKKSLVRYIFLGKSFYINLSNSIFPYFTRLVQNSEGSIKEIANKIQYDTSSMKNMIINGKQSDIFYVSLLIITIIITIFGNSEINDAIGGNLFYVFILPIVTIFCILYISAEFLRYLIESFHPLYAFGNLGEKIQRITPDIEKKSREIRENFEKNMNFSVLSSGFDSLSSTFSSIVSLVIRLERVEKRANKGNLFDSEKYINSLRSDIIEPLKSLRVFLEDQREKLIESQGELSRVRVGGTDPSLHSEGQKQKSGGQEQSELSSKRSEKLIIELGENIEKLDVMIGKMGE